MYLVELKEKNEKMVMCVCEELDFKLKYTFFEKYPFGY